PERLYYLSRPSLSFPSLDWVEHIFFSSRLASFACAPGRRHSKMPHPYGRRPPSGPRADRYRPAYSEEQVARYEKFKSTSASLAPEGSNYKGKNYDPDFQAKRANAAAAPAPAPEGSGYKGNNYDPDFHAKRHIAIPKGPSARLRGDHHNKNNNNNNNNNNAASSSSSFTSSPSAAALDEIIRDCNGAFPPPDRSRPALRMPGAAAAASASSSSASAGGLTLPPRRPAAHQQQPQQQQPQEPKQNYEELALRARQAFHARVYAGLNVDAGGDTRLCGCADATGAGLTCHHAVYARYAALLDEFEAFQADAVALVAALCAPGEAARRGTMRAAARFAEARPGSGLAALLRGLR
ncbi:hypothetical protein F4780DRAFT_786331, partial [Xylariomycetidae sp. FL0641]